VIARCTDGNGVPQDGTVIDIIPQGGSGYMRTTATVDLDAPEPFRSVAAWMYRYVRT
jgi:hypothetical protein